jgi:hypothetical protein
VASGCSAQQRLLPRLSALLRPRECPRLVCMTDNLQPIMPGSPSCCPAELVIATAAYMTKMARRFAFEPSSRNITT